MSDEEEKDDVEDEEKPNKSKKQQKTPQKNSISSISAKLDDLSFSLGMAFPSFGLNVARSSSYQANGSQTRDYEGSGGYTG